ncbi:hypothetical protein CCP3SC1AL1_1140004 [Gammaproteobacteria bacterium]
MKKKLIITESQYIKLQEFLFETPYRRLYSKIQENDVIEIINKGVISKFKVRIFANNYIIMDGITKNVSNYVFAIDKDGLWKSNFEAKKILKNDEKKSNKNIDTWPSFTMVITSFKLIRDNNVIDVADIDGSIPEPITEPTTEPVGKPDDISKPVEMDPNVTSTPETPEETEKVKKQRMYGKKALKAITSDPQLQAAFYRQPSFWKLFMADMQGKTAPGKGIQPTLELINGYMDKKNKENNPDLQPFINSEIADFILPEKVSFTVKSKTLGNKDNTYTIPEKVTLKAKNGPGNWFDVSTNTYKASNMLSYTNIDKSGSIIGTKFDIMVKPPAISKDTFKCDIIVNSNIVAKDVLITFLNSDGYKKDNTK